MPPSSARNASNKPTREGLVHATLELMLQRGYRGTGINDICREAGVSKGAFYHSFASKEEIAVEALTEFYRLGLAKLLSLDVGSPPPEGRLLAFLDAVAQAGPEVWRRGCLIGGLATEMAQSSDSLQAEVARAFRDLTGILAGLAEPFVATLQDDGLTATDLAEQFLVVAEGAIVLSQAYRDPARIGVAIARYADQIRLLPTKTH